MVKKRPLQLSRVGLGLLVIRASPFSRLECMKLTDTAYGGILYPSAPTRGAFFIVQNPYPRDANGRCPTYAGHLLIENHKPYNLVIPACPKPELLQARLERFNCVATVVLGAYPSNIRLEDITLFVNCSIRNLHLSSNILRFWGVHLPSRKRRTDLTGSKLPGFRTRISRR
jgi:hypothetical protein